MTTFDSLGTPGLNSPLAPRPPLGKPVPAIQPEPGPPAPTPNPGAFGKKPPLGPDLSSPLSLRGLYQIMDSRQAVPVPIPEVESTLAGLSDGQISEGDVVRLGRLLDELDKLEPAERRALLEGLGSRLDQIGRSSGERDSLRSLLLQFDPPKGEVEADLRSGFQALATRVGDQVFDEALLAHQSLRMELRSAGVDLHAEAESLFKSKRKDDGDERAAQLPGLLKKYQALGARISAELKNLDQELAALGQSPVPGLSARREQLQQQRTSLLALQAEFVMAEVLDGIKASKSATFGGLRVSVERSARKDLLSEAGPDLASATAGLKAEIVRLEAGPKTDAQQLSMLKDKLSRLESLSGLMATAVSDLDAGLAKADADAAQRALILDAMIGEMESLLREKKPDLLFAAALSNDKALSEQAEKDLLALCDSLIGAIEGNSKAYASWGPGKKPVKLLADLVGELNRFKLKIEQKQLPAMAKAGESFKDAGEPFTSMINSALLEMANSNAYRGGEVGKLKLAATTVREPFYTADLAEKALEGSRFFQLSTDIEGIQVKIGSLAAEAERLLENPERPDDALLDARDAIAKALKQTLLSYGDNLSYAPGDTKKNPSRLAEALASPEVKVLELMQRRTELLTVGPNDLKVYDDQIEKLLKHEIPPDSLDYRALSQLWKSLKSMDTCLNYRSRELAVERFPEAAYAKAKSLAEAADGKHPGKGGFFGIIDKGFKDGKHQGYAIVAYPESDWDRKLAQAGRPGSNLLQVVAKTRGEWYEGGRLPLPLQSGVTLETEGFDPQNLGLLYQDALDHYGRYDTPDYLAASLMKMADSAHQGNPAAVDGQICLYLERVFAFDSGSAKEASAALKKIYKAYLAKVQAGDEAGATAVLTELKASPVFAGIKSAVASRKGLASLKDGMMLEVGKQAKAMVAEQYKDAIARYQGYAAEPDKLFEALMTIAASGSGSSETHLKQMFDVSGAGAQLRGTWVAWQLAVAKGQQTEAAKILADFRQSALFSEIQAGAGKRLTVLKQARDAVAEIPASKAGFQLAAKFDDVRKFIYQQYQVPFDYREGMPTDPSRLDAALYENSTGRTFCYQAESWDDWNTAASIATTAGVITSSLALGLATGGLGAAAGFGVMMATSAGFAAHQIYTAESEAATARAEFSAGLVGYGAVSQADRTVSLSYVSALVQVLSAGASTGLAKAISPQTLIQAMASDAVMSTLSTVVDPLTWQGDARSIAINLTLGGVVSFASSGAGAAFEARLGKAAAEGKLDVVFDQAQGRIYAKGPKGEEVDLIPVAPDGDKVKFRFEGPDGKPQEFSLKVESSMISVGKHQLEPGSVPLGPAEIPTLPRKKEDLIALLNTPGKAGPALAGLDYAKKAGLLKTLMKAPISVDAHDAALAVLKSAADGKPENLIRMLDALGVDPAGYAATSRKLFEQLASVKSELPASKAKAAKGEYVKALSKDFVEIRDKALAVAQAKDRTYLEPYLLAGNPKFKTALKPVAVDFADPYINPDLLTRIAPKPLSVVEPATKISPEVQAQLDLFKPGNRDGFFDGLPDIGTLASKGAWKGERDKAFVFQTYSAELTAADQVMFGAFKAEMREGLESGLKKQYGSIRLGIDTIALEGIHIGSTVGVGKDIAPGTPDPLLTNKPLPIGADGTPVESLTLNLNGFGQEGEFADITVSQLARDLSAKLTPENSPQDISTVMLDEVAMMKKADVIYFGLTGKEWAHPGSVTSNELLTILNDPELLKKTVFYKADTSGEVINARAEGVKATGKYKPGKKQGDAFVMPQGNYDFMQAAKIKGAKKAAKKASSD